MVNELQFRGGWHNADELLISTVLLKAPITGVKYAKYVHTVVGPRDGITETGENSQLIILKAGFNGRYCVELVYRFSTQRNNYVTR